MELETENVTASIQFDTIFSIQWKINPAKLTTEKKGIKRGTYLQLKISYEILRVKRNGYLYDENVYRVSFCPTSDVKLFMSVRLKKEDGAWVTALKSNTFCNNTWYMIVPYYPHMPKELTLEFHLTTNGNELSNDLNSLLNNGLYSDITLKSADGVEFTAHKVILVSRSDVFKAHFEHNTIECTTNIVETSLEAEILKVLLDFIYTGEAPKTEENAEKLLAAADYYGLEQLKYLCGEVLKQQLKVENAIRILQLADLHSAEILKKTVLQFIGTGGMAREIINNEDWSNLDDPDLIKDILNTIVSM